MSISFQADEDPPVSVGLPVQTTRLFRKNLIVYLHAQKCQAKEDSEPSSTSESKCQLKGCSEMKVIINHCKDCKLGEDCDNSDCKFCQEFIKHWKNCENELCEICEPLKSTLRDKEK